MVYLLILSNEAVTNIKFQNFIKGVLKSYDIIDTIQIFKYSVSSSPGHQSIIKLDATTKWYFIYRHIMQLSIVTRKVIVFLDEKGDI